LGFQVPNSIITDNGTQFTGKKFLEFCDDYHIRVDWSAVAHPKTNGQVEHAKDSQSAEQIRQKMACRAPFGHLESKDNPEP
jgi:transposase InsO family protein